MSLLFTYDTRVWLILDSGMLNQLQNWILSEPILLWVPMVPTQNSNTLLAWVMRVEMTLGSLLYIRVFLVIT